MKFRQSNFGCASLRVMLVVPFNSRRNAATVVNDRYGVVRVYRYFNLRGKAGKRFVDGVVDDFVNEVMKA